MTELDEWQKIIKYDFRIDQTIDSDNKDIIENFFKLRQKNKNLTNTMLKGYSNHENCIINMIKKNKIDIYGISFIVILSLHWTGVKKSAKYLCRLNQNNDILEVQELQYGI